METFLSKQTNQLI